MYEMKKYIKIKPSNKTIKSFNIYNEIKNIEKKAKKAWVNFKIPV